MGRTVLASAVDLVPDPEPTPPRAGVKAKAPFTVRWTHRSSAQRSGVAGYTGAMRQIPAASSKMASSGWGAPATDARCTRHRTRLRLLRPRASATGTEAVDFDELRRPPGEHLLTIPEGVVGIEQPQRRHPPGIDDRSCRSAAHAAFGGTLTARGHEALQRRALIAGGLPTVRE